MKSTRTSVVLGILGAALLLIFWVSSFLPSQADALTKTVWSVHLVCCPYRRDPVAYDSRNPKLEMVVFGRRSKSRYSRTFLPRRDGVARRRLILWQPCQSKHCGKLCSFRSDLPAPFSRNSSENSTTPKAALLPDWRLPVRRHFRLGFSNVRSWSSTSAFEHSFVAQSDHRIHSACAPCGKVCGQ